MTKAERMAKEAAIARSMSRGPSQDLVKAIKEARSPDLIAASEAVIPHLKQNIEDIGGCDHSAGICCCDLIQATDNLIAAIAKARQC